MAVPQHRGTPSPSAHRVWIRRLACALLGASLALPATAQTVAPTLELQVKAAFLYNFAKFVTWPADARLPPDAPFVIGVSGDDAFAGALEQAVRDKSGEGHPLEVRRGARPHGRGRRPTGSPPCRPSRTPWGWAPNLPPASPLCPLAHPPVA